MSYSPTNNVVIHPGVVLHGITMAPNSTITNLVTSQAIIPIVPVIIDNTTSENSNNSDTQK